MRAKVLKCRLAVTLVVVVAQFSAGNTWAQQAQGHPVSPPAATITDFNPHQQFTNQLDFGPGGRPGIQDTMIAGPNLRLSQAAWTLTYTNGSRQVWRDFHITVTGIPGPEPGVRNDSFVGIRGAEVTSGFGATPNNEIPMRLIPKRVFGGTYFKEAVIEVRDADGVRPGKTATFEVRVACFARNGVRCNYHLEVRPSGGT
jgi:hypothetical protein